MAVFVHATFFPVTIVMHFYTFPFLIMAKFLARACGLPVGRRSGGWLALTLVATINVIIFHFPFSVTTFSHRKSVRIKKLIEQTLTGAPKNLRVDTFPDPCRSFWGPLPAILAVRKGSQRHKAGINSSFIILHK